MSRCTRGRRPSRGQQLDWYRGISRDGVRHLLRLERRQAIRMAEKHLGSHPGMCSQCGMIRVGFIGRLLRTHLDLAEVGRRMDRARRRLQLYHARRKHW